MLRRNIQEDAILHSHRRENLKSYIATLSLSGRFQLHGIRLTKDVTYCPGLFR
jgi:hypothetical protein